MNNDDIKQVFLYCENNDPDGLYADDVDILEFGRKVAAVAFAQGQRAERQFCVDFTATLNKEVAKALQAREVQYGYGNPEVQTGVSGTAG